MSDRWVYTFEKKHSQVRAFIAEVRGRRYAHIREFVEPRARPGANSIAPYL